MADDRLGLAKANKLTPLRKVFPDQSNDQNLWMAPRPGDVKERTFPRMI